MEHGLIDRETAALQLGLTLTAMWRYEDHDYFGLTVVHRDGRPYFLEEEIERVREIRERNDISVPGAIRAMIRGRPRGEQFYYHQHREREPSLVKGAVIAAFLTCCALIAYVTVQLNS